MQEFSGDDVKEISDIDAPFIMKKNAKIGDWMNSSKIQVALGSFGGRYKKTDTFQAHGKAQMTIFSKEGKEESIALVNGIMSLFPNTNKVTQENDFARITQTLWLFGYDPAMCSVSPTPNGMAMLKVLAYGEVKWLVMECCSLLAALRTELQQDSISLDDIEGMVGALSAESLENCKKHRLKCYSCLQQPNDLVYVPAGWITVEQSVKDMLIYGLRASLLLRSDASHTSYEGLIGLYSSSNKPVDKMKQALDLMAPIS